MISFSEADLEAQVQLDPKFRKPIELDNWGRPILGKFDIYDEGMMERVKQGITIVSWNDIVDWRIIPKD